MDSINNIHVTNCDNVVFTTGVSKILDNARVCSDTVLNPPPKIHGTSAGLAAVVAITQLVGLDALLMGGVVLSTVWDLFQISDVNMHLVRIGSERKCLTELAKDEPKAEFDKNVVDEVINLEEEILERIGDVARREVFGRVTLLSGILFSCYGTAVGSLFAKNQGAMLAIGGGLGLAVDYFLDTSGRENQAAAVKISNRLEKLGDKYSQ